MVRLRRLVATGTIAALIAALWLASPVMWQSVAHANSADATLSVLLVKNETHLWVIAPPDTTWDVDVPNSVSTLTVDALPSNSQASYVVRFGGATAPDGNVSLSVGSNVITVEVTAGDGETTKTYTVTVTRAENTPATGAPTITGSAQVGQTLTAEHDRNLRRRRPDQRQLQLSVAGRRHRDRRGDELHLHGPVIGQRQDHRGAGHLHRRRGQRGVADQRGERRRW